MATDKIVRYPRVRHLNLGVVIFVVILFYVLYHLVTYLTATHLAIYEVEYGTIAESNTYQGLLLRDELVVNADFSGEVNYYLKDASKAGVKTLVCSIDENGSISGLIEQSAAAESLPEESLEEISETISDFKTSYNSNSFFRVYDFKENIESEIMEAINLAALTAVQQSSAYASGAVGFHTVNAVAPGVAVYYVDGYEGVTADTFTPEMLNELNYARTNLKTTPRTSVGQPLYKLVTSEDWSIVLPVDEATYWRLAGSETIRIRFLEDNETSYASYTFREINGAYYMVLTLNNSMIRYANSRFTEIELLLDEQTGLKIPNSAIVQKEFFVVPKSYFAQGGDSSDYGVLLISVDEDGNESMGFVATDLYDETDDAYYINESALAAGSVIQDPASGARFTLGETASLSGVFNVNKGYAVFKQIEPLFQNAEYTIVKTGTSYGISLYDHIALEGTKVSEGELVN